MFLYVPVPDDINVDMINVDILMLTVLWVPIVSAKATELCLYLIKINAE